MLLNIILCVELLDFKECYDERDVAKAEKPGSFFAHVRNVIDGDYYKIKEIAIMRERPYG